MADETHHQAARDEEEEEVQVVEAVPQFPPRPDAIVTLLTSDDFSPGAQTLLYSVKNLLSKDLRYPPELVVLCTPNVSLKTRQGLTPFCHRVVQVPPIDFPTNATIDKQQQVVRALVEHWNHQGVLTKLHIFNLTIYDTILYLDADCLVVRDVSHLLNLGKLLHTTTTESSNDSLIAAAPDIFPPHKFNAGVMVVRPDMSTFHNMMEQRTLLTTYDGGDTGFLNSYFSNWYTDMPSFSRLSFGYNAQRFMYHCTYERQPNYWDLGVAPDLHVIHYSSSPKPWEGVVVVKDDKNSSSSSAAQHWMEEQDRQTLSKVSKSAELEALWKKHYQMSKNYAKLLFQKEEAEIVDGADARADAAVKEQEEETAEGKSNSNDTTVHQQIAKRYRQLRVQGKDTKEAMQMARAEFGLDEQDDNNSNVSVSNQVAALFGVI